MIKNVQLCNSLSKVNVPHSQNYYMKNIYKAGEFHFRTAMPYHIIHNNTTLNVYMMLKKKKLSSILNKAQYFPKYPRNLWLLTPKLCEKEEMLAGGDVQHKSK